MIEADYFLVSFDLIESKIGIGFCEPILITYRTEELTPYLRGINQELNPDHLHMRSIKKEVSKLLGPYQINIIDIIRTEL